MISKRMKIVDSLQASTHAPTTVVMLSTTSITLVAKKS